jgi:hypothetical protein
MISRIRHQSDMEEPEKGTDQLQNLPK